MTRLSRRNKSLLVQCMPSDWADGFPAPLPAMDLAKLRPPRPWRGREIDRGKVFKLLALASFAAERSRLPSATRKTRTALKAVHKAAAELERDQGIPAGWQAEFGRVSNVAERCLDILETMQQPRGRRGSRLLDHVLDEIKEEIARATGSPHWDFFLKLLKQALPATFPAKATIHNLRSRVRYVSQPRSGARPRR